MALAGARTDNDQDYASRNAPDQLPYHLGGETTLATTDVDERLVRPGSLVRFENLTNFATGTHTGSGNAASLTDSAGDFVNKGVEIGDLLSNDTDGSTTTITGVTATNLTGTLAGGTDDDWDASDAYSIDKKISHQSSSAVAIHRVRIITDLDVYIRYDGDASSGQHTIRLNAGESLNEDSLRIVAGISFINVTSGATPTLRWYVAGA